MEGLNGVEVVEEEGMKGADVVKGVKGVELVEKEEGVEVVEGVKGVEVPSVRTLMASL